MRIMLLGLGVMAMIGLTGCGRNNVQRATTGAVAGAVVAGPIGAAAGAALGGTGAVEVRRPRGF